MDLNLLSALDALLTEGSVNGAANRLGLSPSAMSRTLARLRSATGDQLLVRAGRGLVPTPRAIELRTGVQTLVRDVAAVLSPRSEVLQVDRLEQTFTIRANEGFMEVFSAHLLSIVINAAPGVRLRFSPKPAKNVSPLREGGIDLEIGVLGTSGPEIRTRTLFRDKFVGAVRAGHPVLEGRMTPERYAQQGHVVASRRGAASGPVDVALSRLGLARRIVSVVPGFPDALRIARSSDLVGLVPRLCLEGGPAGKDPLADGLVAFELPVRTPEIAISMMWHPRMDGDLAHRWLREVVASVCTRSPLPSRGTAPSDT